MKLLLCLLAFNVCASAQSALPSELLAAMDVKWPKNRVINLVFHGHSVPAGYQKTPDVRPFEAYPQLVFQGLKKAHPFAVMNCIVTAIGGEDSLSGAARFEKDVLCHQPDVIFIDYALNDRRQPLDKVEASWKSMIRLAKQRKIPVVLITPTGDSNAKLNDPADPLCQRAELIRKIAKDENVPLADVFAAWQAEVANGTPQTELRSQPNHPN
ncbi:MAG: lipase [Verrucomicrobiales bacterium VVV1]|nr:MAG: lipase [Verrucomicrobiales bacterium VVV1]